MENIILCDRIQDNNLDVYFIILANQDNTISDFVAVRLKELTI